MKSLPVKFAVVVGISLVLATAAANAAGPEATRPGQPRTRVVPDGKGGLRVDVVDRPWNGSPGAIERARQAAVPAVRRAPP